MNVSLKIFDLLGNSIATLVEKEQAAGVYEVVFDASNLPSGIYFYKLKAAPIGGQAGNFVDTKKMILLK